MEKVLEKAIKKAKAYGLPMVVYENKENMVYYQMVHMRKLVLQTYTTDNILAGVKSSQFFL